MPGDARETIGPSHPTDYRIAPAGHAALYGGAAPDLAAALSDEAVADIAERYQVQDGEAVDRQRSFASTATRARTAVFWTGVSSALLLAGGSLSAVLPELTRRGVIGLATIGAVVAGALAAMWIRRLKEGRLLERWMSARAQAEESRLRYFEVIVLGEAAVDASLRLEYFRRYQLDVQRAYFTGRGRDHRLAADRALRLSSMAVAGSAIASGLAGVLGVFDPAWTALAAVGLTAQALAAKIGNEEATAQSRRNAERFERTRLALDRIAGQLDDVRTAVAAGDTAVLEELVRTTHDQLSVEHRQWLEEMDAASAAVAHLEELLAKYREDRQPDGE